MMYKAIKAIFATPGLDETKPVNECSSIESQAKTKLETTKDKKLPMKTKRSIYWSMKNNNEQRDTVMAMIKAGKINREIFDKTGVSHAFLYKCKREANAIRPSNDSRREKLLSLIKKQPCHWTPKMLAKELSVSSPSIYKMIGEIPFLEKCKTKGSKNKYFYHVS